MTNGEICVPASAVSVGGGEAGGESTAPETGDSVDVQMGGKVTRVEGGNVYFTPETANGQPLPKMGGEMGEEDDKTYLDRMHAENMKGMP